MTSQQRDFDRLARAWLELGPNEAADRSIAAVLQAIETTPQVRRPWRWPTWRSTTMSRITILAVLAGTIALIVGGLVLSGGGPGPEPRPAPTAGPSAPAPSESATPILPAGLRGGWVAPSRGTSIEDLGEGPQGALAGSAAATTVVFTPSADFTTGPGFWLDRPGTPLLRSAVTEESPGVVRITMTTTADPDCVGADSGTYRWSQTPDGQWLTFELIEDACEIRAEILAGTWQRSLAHDSPGGPGIAAVFEPYFTFTLPADPYVGWGLATDTVVADRPDRTFKVWKDLDGFLDPCDRSKGRLLIEPGMDALLAYLREDPRFTVTKETEFEIDGHRAVDIQFRIGADLTAPCWDFDGDPANKTGVLTWVPGADGNAQAFWNAPINSRGSLVVTEVDGTTLTFESLTVDGSQFATDLQVLDSIRFVDGLPEPPTS